MELAKKRERETGKPQYIVRVGELFTIIDTFPLCCHDWWTTDGIQHG